MSKPKVFLVGAGPGDKELITLKGLRILSRADVILYDHLIAHDLLLHAKEDAECICVGKHASNHTLPQEEIHRLLIAKAQEGKTVVRLKGGDSYLFGRGGEEAEACYEAGVDFEVVPGVTSALAAGSYAGIPPTHRDYASGVAIVTGHRKKDDPRPVHIPLADTVIILMAVGNIDTLVQSLRAAGYPPETPIAAIEHATCYDQRVLTGTVETFSAIVKEQPLRTPAVFIVGKVVTLREKLDWFSRQPRILHLGTNPERYHPLGLIVHRPIIQCVESGDNERIRRSVADAGRFNWILFTSGNAIDFFFRKLHAMHMDARIFSGTKFAVIGKTSEERLLQFGIQADLCPAVESSRGLLDAFETARVADASMLLPQSEIVSEELAHGLSERGAKVETFTLYTTIERPIEDVDLCYIDQILFTSSSTVHAFVRQFGSVPKHIKALCLGIPTQVTARQYNIAAEIIQKE